MLTNSFLLKLSDRIICSSDSKVFLIELIKKLEKDLGDIEEQFENGKKLLINSGKYPINDPEVDAPVYSRALSEQFKLLKNHYSNLLLLNFIRILWYKNGSFNNEQFFTDICKPKPRNLDYLEFMMTCIKNNVYSGGNWDYGDHSFVYLGIIPKTKEMLLKYTGNSMQTFLQCKIEDVK